MEPFLQYMAGGPCYECGGKTKYAGGGQRTESPIEAQQGEQSGPDEQAQQLMMFLTEQISKGTSPSVLKRTLTQSGVKSKEAEQLVQIATQLFEEKFQQGLEPQMQEQMQQPQMQQPFMQENPFGPSAEEEQQMMKYGGLKKFIEGGFDKEVKLDNPNGSYTVKEVDPEYTKKLSDPNNITVTNKNQISNIKDTKFNRGLAYMSGLSNPNSAIANLPDAGGFGAGLKFLAGAAGFLGSAGLGIKKFTADDRTRMYDKDGNILTDSQNPDKYVKTIDKTVTPSQTASSLINDAKNMFANKAAEIPGFNSYASFNGKSTSPNPAVGIDTSYAKSKEEPMAAMPIIKMPTEEELKQKEANLKLANSKLEGTIAEQEAGQAKYDAANQFNNATNFRPDVTKQKISPEESQALMQVQDRMDAGLGFEEGGEWNPFVDNRRKLKFTMPLYAGGGPIDNETSPYSQQEWAIKQSKSFPLLPDDVKLYDEYAASFKNNTNTIQDLTNVQKLAMQQPVTYGDPLGKVVANNALNGMQMMANATDYFANQKKEDELKRKRMMAGNTMEAAPVVNPENPYGSMYTLNAGPGANQNVAQLGYRVDSGTTMASAKYGGMTQYKTGGVYQVSPEELQRIIDMGGEVEFLD